MESSYFLGADPAFSTLALGNFSGNQCNPLLFLDQAKQGPSPMFSLPQTPSLDSGWTSQSIPVSTGPVSVSFSRPMVRQSNSRKGRNRGQNANSTNRINRQRSWNRKSSEGHSSSSDDNWSVDETVSTLLNCPEEEPIPTEVFNAIRCFDSRTCSTLLKDLSKSGHSSRALEVFDWLRSSFNELADVYTYTAMISSCLYKQDVNQALKLVEEMTERDIERNVHTYTALMNVCIKSGSCQLALDSFEKMKSDGIEPNVVTYNTLIDIHGKMGQWEKAIRVFINMEADGIKPVLRTFNTLIISCNMCNQPREALAVYSRLLTEGFTPNATTYNALISAHGKAGQLDKVMEVFQEMVWRGCERTVITYSSLISACEKAGQWEIALQLFNEMQREDCMPNTVTYNSLITACAQGAQWEKASEVFEQMKVQGCAPDVVTYTALISANERGGQWLRALHAYDQMLHQGCNPDAIVYNAIIDTLWETGVIWAQRKALEIFKAAKQQGHFQQQLVQNGVPVEVNLHALTAGVAVLSLYNWLLDLKVLAEVSGAGALPKKLFVVSDKGRQSKEQGNLIVKEAVAALLQSWNSPFRLLQDSMYSGVLKASGTDLASWLTSPCFEEKLFSFFPCTNLIPSIANQIPFTEALTTSTGAGCIDDPNFSNELSVECQCNEAFTAVRQFETFHSLTLQAMGLNYLQNRTFLVQQILNFGKQFMQESEIAHDAVLLMDRVMSTSIQIEDNLLKLLSVACLVLSMKQSTNPDGLPNDLQIEQVTDYNTSAIAGMEFSLQQVLNGDTSTISTLRCVKLYLSRLGTDFLDEKSVHAIAGAAPVLVQQSMTDLTFLNCRPSVVAAAILYAERRSRGVIPYWPSILAKLTGYQDMSSPELTVAIRGAQKLCQQTDQTVVSLGGGGMMNLNVSGPLMELAALQSLVPVTSSLAVEEDQVTVNRIDGVVVNQSTTTIAPSIAQGLTQVTSSESPIMTPSASELLGSGLCLNRMNFNALGAAFVGGLAETEVRGM
eukprot:g8192.t1